MVIAFFSTTATPDGAFSIISADNKVLASGWNTTTQELLSLIHSSIRPDQLEEVPAHNPQVSFALDAVHAYYQGEIHRVAEVAVSQVATAFQEKAWQCLREVSPGNPISYRDYAALCGAPRAIRAVASACARNSAALFVPCHRIIRSDGSLGGFRYGLEIKRALLERESLQE
ncbi:methylated-DNA--[protein]-cysteine S-methyltransferase [Corynebacterium sp. sy017]|uniref:methylated-DNA--[protein]-cysteine S-methyltransferase n=1 Tax=unclassified Corynebacterium TaxID=2624378 RepID=UPI0011867170|nr:MULTISPECIES: methylated-DNA--[protein]-cysteine S-methyltransferase [unclassified Corynebacterium]MBP3087836.1 methylated-DNA--[protein]-cysteine S-methyltransferase [Corynebacterium sp. sy017]QDZ42805.1 methylated-DNA--[protein]-cysteine S-methyltransferase [Corynebacterium sp. sy039]TSD92379.1 methylated-DNA--[protein]-cysteine S-methyltransferase [Corynebacterium sp. SY003]